MVADRIVPLDYQTRGRAMFGFGPGPPPQARCVLFGAGPWADDHRRS
jgi:hypothetical protein